MFLKLNKDTKKIVEARTSEAYPEEEGFISAEKDVPSCCAGGTLDGDTFTPAPKRVVKKDLKADALKALDPENLTLADLKTVVEYLQK